MYEFWFKFKDGSEIHLTRVASFPNSFEKRNAITDPSINMFACIMASDNRDASGLIDGYSTDAVVYHYYEQAEINPELQGFRPMIIPLENCIYRFGKNLETGLTLEEERKLFLHEQEKRALYDSFFNDPNRPMLPIERNLNPDTLWYYVKKMELWNKVYKEESDDFRKNFLPIGYSNQAELLVAERPVVFDPDELWEYKAWRDFRIGKCKDRKLDVGNNYQVFEKIKRDGEYREDPEWRMPADLRSYWVDVNSPKGLNSALIERQEKEEAENREKYKPKFDINDLIDDDDFEDDEDEDRW